MVTPEDFETYLYAGSYTSDLERFTAETSLEAQFRVTTSAIVQSLGEACLYSIDPTQQNDRVWDYALAVSRAHKENGREVSGDTFPDEYRLAKLQSVVDKELIEELAIAAVGYVRDADKRSASHTKARLLDGIDIFGYGDGWAEAVNELLPVSPYVYTAGYDEQEAAGIDRTSPKVQIAWELIDMFLAGGEHGLEDGNSIREWRGRMFDICCDLVETATQQPLLFDEAILYDEMRHMLLSGMRTDDVVVADLDEVLGALMDYRAIANRGTASGNSYN
ncbi:hypothetical protein H7Y40_01775 [Pedobacter sp.]|nr:hypothetical protein [Candidatus Saccharibacteria bacterium]